MSDSTISLATNDQEHPVQIEDDRTGMHPVTLERAVLDHLHYTLAKEASKATYLDVYHAVALAVRDRLVHRWVNTKRAYRETDCKRVYYLSAEFLLGRQLSQNLACLGLTGVAADLLHRYGLDIDKVIAREPDPGLGNGGLGRLAACFLDSMATLGLPGMGYGIRYEFGIFEQQIVDGWQIEHADSWLRSGNPWELPRPEYTVTVRFYGNVVDSVDDRGNYRARWVDTRSVLGVPYDMLVPGYRNLTVNTLRLWSARASQQLDLAVFNAGDYRRAVEEKALTESISKVLYPADESPEGKELRLKQQYFFVACSIADIMRRYRLRHNGWSSFPVKNAIQLNDTHPAVAVAELMRVLLDDENLGWDEAWDITRETIGYTNHTLLPEALERWPEPMFARLLPRHLQIIREINLRFLRRVEVRSRGDNELMRRVSIFEEGEPKHIRMANLAVVGSHSVNGVAQLHSDLVRTHLLRDFAEMWPEKFNNKTNGVTPRRWLLLANPRLSEAITARIGEGWARDLSQLEKLAPLADDPELHAELRAIKVHNKRRLAALIERRLGIAVDPLSLFDVQVKRIHEYKRQLLNCLHVVAMYLEVRKGADIPPRTFVFAGKAAPGYAAAKMHIKLIGDVAATINGDPEVAGRMKVVFVPNYGVTLAESIIPAADLSEQISTAGKEASGTGNMKFAMNGALTIGTLDGANIEIREQVGAEHFFLFGLTADEVAATRAAGYSPGEHIARSPRLQEVLALIESGFFSPDEPRRFRDLMNHLRTRDPYLVCADFDAYVAAQQQVSASFADPEQWSRSVIHNIANTGVFSSDRTIREYARDIWRAEPVLVEPLPE